jgi:hypothetical protein
MVLTDSIIGGWNVYEGQKTKRGGTRFFGVVISIKVELGGCLKDVRSCVPCS